MDSTTTQFKPTFPVQLDSQAQVMAFQLLEEQPPRPDLALRLYLEGKGCDGFYYGVSFDEKQPDDMSSLMTCSLSGRTLNLVIDLDTVEFVAGAVITWVDDDRGRGFLVENPSHRKFRGKFYKRRKWQDRLSQKNAEVAAKPGE